jgi:hypothetical protein
MNLRLANKADWQRLVAYIKTLPWRRDDKAIQYRISIDEIKPGRSGEQNRRYWALLTAISQQAPPYMGGEWHSQEVWAEYAKKRFLGMERGPYGGGVAKSSAKLTVGEFMDYMMEIEVWAYDEFDGFDFNYDEVV